jgi:hypothetical protein
MMLHYFRAKKLKDIKDAKTKEGVSEDGKGDRSTDRPMTHVQMMKNGNMPSTRRGFGRGGGGTRDKLTISINLPSRGARASAATIL